MSIESVRHPAEWEPQEWLWIGFPHDPAEWGDALAPAQEEIAGFANAVAESGQPVRLLVRDAANEARAKALVSGDVTLERRSYGDVWLRDTGPIVVDRGGARHAVRPGFNGWGGKYRMAGDESIGGELARDAGLPLDRPDWVLEGGAIDTDGAGTLLTTDQCLLNPNRNPDLSRTDIEARLKHDFGAERIVWLGDGLLNDHTDGHVDNLARFVAPGTVALAEPFGEDDPNAQVYADAKARLGEAGLKVASIPSPGRISRGPFVEPASYANFAICNSVIAVPTFGLPQDADAVAAIDSLFPTRTAIGLPMRSVLAGGGGFHCASMQMPGPIQRRRVGIS
ncbi:agmatine deiminase family protein [Alteriqipengyuania lutimaris]|uniref:Agmatine deiminase family protein n=1 Tax=Alteriqipengyuania lutimaris TaxID=1538146 RepID=A0A395LIV9_9SPHN|nr:agmatine deiminase family protein [Alteriqipengyuania lutimaris]MBB3034212.1 agmatine deiminase [Alteriqipengyuania lutimaris]RDS76868.1 agmatine deiminase family protein [Alteriqipengyuania lutimaris]